MDIRFDGKTIVVTGGSSGIGKATVMAFAASGGKVVFTGIEPERSIDPSGYHGPGDIVPVYYRLDIRKEEDVRSFAAWIEDNHGGCDVLFNNAGVLDNTQRIHEVPTDAWLDMLDINLNGVFYAAKHFIPQMLKKGRGAIVNTSSISGLFADYNLPVYNASKGAVANLTRNMAIDYVRHGIRINAVAPGSIRTPLYFKFAQGVGGQEFLDLAEELVYPTDRNGNPEEVANAVLFLASDQASFINGVNLVIDGGITAHTGQPRYWDIARLVAGERKRVGTGKA